MLLGDVATKLAKHGWSDSSIACTLKKVPRAAGAYDVRIMVRPYMTATPMTLRGAFSVMNPEVDVLPIERGVPGREIAITGRFFGTKKGKVRLEDAATGKRRNCKVTFWYMDKVAGDSELRFIVPKSTRVFGPGSYVVRVSNRVGSAGRMFTME